MPNVDTFDDLPALAQHLRDELEQKKFVLLYAYNGTGKTRLSTAFKDLGKITTTDTLVTEEGDQIVTEDGDHIVTEEITQGDTLYFNAFTEDLFFWDNDLDKDIERTLKINTDSSFFAGLDEVEMDNRIGPLLERYTDVGFYIDIDTWEITFFYERDKDGNPVPVKISRSEENIFIWCFFLAVVELALDKDLAIYNWVKYIYVDDPISSLDDQNAVQVAVHLVNLLHEVEDIEGVVISTHHPLFHNVLWNELRGQKMRRFFFGVDKDNDNYTIRDSGSTPFFYHLASLVALYKDAEAGNVERRHYNTLRAIAEKAASFHGYRKFEDCIQDDTEQFDSNLHRRFLNLYSHGGYSHFDTAEIQDDDRKHFRDMLHIFLKRFRFNEELFPEREAESKESIALA